MLHAPLSWLASAGLDKLWGGKQGKLPCLSLASSGLVRLWRTRLGTLGSPLLQMASTGKDKPWDARTGLLCSPLPFHDAEQGSLTSIFHAREPVRGSRNISPTDHLWKAGQALGSQAEVAVPPLPCLA